MTVCTTQPETRFAVGPDTFSYHRQYSKIYSARFSTARPALIAASFRKWKARETPDGASSGPPIRSVADLVGNEVSVVIGTIFKEMKLKPSILRDIIASESTGAQQTTLPVSLLLPGDIVFLEDDVQRIRLSFASSTITANELSTGVVVALLGQELENDPGTFVIEDIAFIEPQPPSAVSVMEDSSPLTSLLSPDRFHRSGPWLAVVSGLGFSGSSSSLDGADSPEAAAPGHAMALQLLADWLRRAGDWSPAAAGVGEEEEAANAQGIVRLLILGDSIRPAPKKDGFCSGRQAQQARYLTRHVDADSVTAMSRFDQWLASLPLGRPAGLTVDLLPGPADPTSQLMPQQPVHAAVLPLACARSGSSGGLVGRTNPNLSRMEVQGDGSRTRVVLATSGQGVNDLARYTDLTEPCDRMEACLLWGHLAPTCPDTLPGYPLDSSDLMLMSTHIEGGAADGGQPVASDDYPDVFVSGCQPGRDPSWRRARLHWSTDVDGAGGNAEGALLVAVPRFDVSACLVLVHLGRLDCCVVRFDTSLLDGR